MSKTTSIEQFFLNFECSRFAERYEPGTSVFTDIDALREAELTYDQPAVFITASGITLSADAEATLASLRDKRLPIKIEQVQLVHAVNDDQVLDLVGKDVGTLLVACGESVSQKVFDNVSMIHKSLFLARPKN